MKYLILTTSYPRYDGDPGGHFVEAEAQALAEGGHEVLVAAAGLPPTKQTPNERLTVLGLGGRHLFGWPGALARFERNPFVLFELLGVLARARPLIRQQEGRLRAHWLLPFAWFAARTRLSNPSTLRHDFEAIAHGSDVRLLCRLPRALRERIMKDLYAARCKITFVSQRIKEELEAKVGPSLRSHIETSTVRPVEVDTSSAPLSKRKARANLAIDEERRLLVVMGRLVPSKRTHIALRAATLVPDADVVCVGSGPLESSLRRTFPDVLFIGQVDRTRALLWLQSADALLTASKLEGSPLAVREAQALGVPVIGPEEGLPDWSALTPDTYPLSAAP